jgi:hypothetical protein
MTRRRAPPRREMRLKSRSTDNPVIAANGRPTHCLLDGSVRHPDAERRDRECREQRADQALAVRHDQVAGLVPPGIHVLGVLRVRMNKEMPSTYCAEQGSSMASTAGRRIASIGTQSPLSVVYYEMRRSRSPNAHTRSRATARRCLFRISPTTRKLHALSQFTAPRIVLAIGTSLLFRLSTQSSITSSTTNK